LNRTRQITEAGLFAAIMIILMIGSYYIPVIGTLLFFIMPLPVIILTIRNTLPNTIVATIVATLISSAMVTIVVGIGNGALALFVGLPLGYCFKRKDSTLKSIALGGIGALAAYLVILGAAQGFLGLSITEQLDQMFDISGTMQTEMNTIFGALNNDALNASMAETQTILENMQHMIKLIFPSALIIFSMVYSAINYLFARPILTRLRIAVRPIGSFASFSYPKHMAFGGGMMLILAYLVGYLGIADPELVFTNFLYLFLMVFSIQGLSLLYYFLLKFMPRGFAIAMIVFLTLSQFLYYISIIGFFDVMINFRKRGTIKR
jgi:uncharacterized protein YybS (DUF2232 family)